MLTGIRLSSFTHTVRLDVLDLFTAPDPFNTLQTYMEEGVVFLKVECLIFPLHVLSFLINILLTGKMVTRVSKKSFLWFTKTCIERSCHAPLASAAAVERRGYIFVKV